MRRLIVSITLLIVTVVLFWPVVSHGHLPIPTNYMVSWYEPWKTGTTVGGVPTIPHKPVVDDAFRHLYPLRVLASETMRMGEWPLWNPYNGGGTPLLAIMHPGFLTPFGFVFLFLPPHIAWTIYIGLQPIILGFTTYWYGRKLVMSRLGALFAAVSLVLSGFAVVRLEYGEFLYVLAGLPLLLGIVEDARRSSKHIKKLWIPFIIAIMIISGQPHMVVYTLSIFAIYTLVRLPWRQTVEFAALSILGVGMAGVQLVSSYELFTHSTINRLTSEFIFDKFLLPASHLITILIPNFFGNQAIYNYFGPHDYVETIAYIGSIPTLFALFAIRNSRKDVVIRFFTILALVATLTTLRWVGAKLFFLLPIPVLSSDVPSRVFVLVTFAMSVLAGIGVTAWEKEKPEVRRQWVWGFGVVLGVILLCAYVLYRVQAACPPTIEQCRMVSIRTTAIELVGFGLFAGTLLVLRKGLVWLAVTVVLVLGLYNAQKFLPFSPIETIFPKLPIIASLAGDTGLNRFATVGEAAIRSNLMAMYKLSSTDYFDPLHIRRYAELISYVNTGDRTKGLTRSDVIVTSDATPSAEIILRRERFWDMTGTSTLVTKEQEQWRVNERKSAFPRAYLVSQVRVEPDPEKALALLFSADLDLGQVAVVEKEMPDMTPVVAIGTATIHTYTANRLEVSVEAATNALLVLSDTYYPGWNAFIDGNQVPVYRTNYTFRGVMVPKGRHEVVFHYQPLSFYVGLWVSGVSVVVWIVLVFWYNKARGSVAKR